MSVRYRPHVIPALGLIVALAPMVASGGPLSAAPAHKPYTLMIRYGSLPGVPPAPTALPGTPARPGKAFSRALATFARQRAETTRIVTPKTLVCVHQRNKGNRISPRLSVGRQRVFICGSIAYRQQW